MIIIGKDIVYYKSQDINQQQHAWTKIQHNKLLLAELRLHGDVNSDDFALCDSRPLQLIQLI